MLHTKALYNLLRFNVREDPSIPHEPWAVEDLRAVPEQTLYARLKKFGIGLDRERFIQFADDCDTPEELAEILLHDSADQTAHDPAYLLLFELWRRLLPQKTSLSIFCDELDHLIELFDRKNLKSDEPVQDILANLQEILDENTDGGADPQDVFAAVEEDCAHDVESFLYDYISDLITSGNPHYASELIEGFSPYMPEPAWFELLDARVLSFTDIEAANIKVAKMLEKKPDLLLLFDILRFLSTAGDRDLFHAAANQALLLLETEEDFREMLSIVSKYYRLLDQDDLEKAVQKLMKRKKSLSDLLDPEDPDLLAFSEMIR